MWFRPSHPKHGASEGGPGGADFQEGWGTKQGGVPSWPPKAAGKIINGRPHGHGKFMYGGQLQYAKMGSHFNFEKK